VHQYIHSPIRLHGIVLNKLSTGRTLLFFLLLVCIASSTSVTSISVCVNNEVSSWFLVNLACVFTVAVVHVYMKLCFMIMSVSRVYINFCTSTLEELID
jgi:hypothetical protein